MDLTNRKRLLEGDLAEIDRGLARFRRRLAQAPAWYVPGTPPANATLDQRRTYRELQRVSRRIAGFEKTRLGIAELIEFAERNPRAWEGCYPYALKWLNGARTWRVLAKKFVADPATQKLVALGLFQPLEGRRLRRAFTDIIAYRDGQPRQKIRRLEDLVGIPSISERILRGILYTGCTLAPAVVASPVVPVLLPVRLETRFDKKSDNPLRWRLRLRIVPDNISIDRLDSEVSESEIGLTRRLWAATKGDLDSEHGKAAWAEFVSRVGGPRAAWLIREYPMILDSDGGPGIAEPDSYRDEPYFGRLRGFPEKLEIWIGRAGADPQLETTLTVDRNAIAELTLPDVETGEVNWWNSYKEAERVGLGTSIEFNSKPDDIDVILVTGVSDESSRGWFRNQCANGHTALIEPGVPTNSVDGEAAAPLSGSPEHWLDVSRGIGVDGAGIRAVARMLTGDQDNAAPVLGGDIDLEKPMAAMVAGVWHSLWGHPLKDMLGLGADVHEAGTWAIESLRPTGPYPALRVGSQPYGLLPVTPLDKWKPDTNQPGFEQAALDCMVKLRDYWIETAESEGNVVGADTDRLLDLVGHNPSTEEYAWRSFLPLASFMPFWWTLGSPPQWGNVVSTYQQWWQFVEALCDELDPGLRLSAFGAPDDLELPLVLPTNISEDVFRNLLKTLGNPDLNLPSLFYKKNGWEELTDGVIPDSLLIRLLVFSHWVAAAEVVRSTIPDENPRLPQLAWNEGTGTRIQQDAWGPLRPGSSPAHKLRLMLQKACRQMVDMPAAAMEQALRACLDSSSHRLDPWLTGYASRRLEQEGSAWPRRLGVYGWVDSPKPGDPGPNEIGLLHAPSHEQAYVSMILRDRAVHDSSPGRWDIGLDSEVIRAAHRISASVRAGLHISEALGAEVERVVADTQLVDQLREEFPILDEHLGRRTCDGLAVLQGNLNHITFASGVDSALDRLREAIDAYGDLLVAGAAHMVVSGRGETAGALMDAAAGLAQPPELDVLHTSRTGRTVEYTVLIALPDVDDSAAGDPGVATTSPTRLAEPGFAAWLDGVTGPTDGQTWLWQAQANSAPVEVSLDDLGLAACDAAILPEDALRELVMEQAGEDAVVDDDSPAWETHRRARALVTVAGAEPATGEHLSRARSDNDDYIRQGLIDRLQSAMSLGVLVETTLRSAVSANEATQLAALRNALRWGIRSLAAAGESIAERLVGGADAIADRIAAVPPSTDWQGLSIADLARVLAEFVAADSRWPVLSTAVPSEHALTMTEDSRPAGTAVNPIDEQWLSVVAGVRPHMARVEAAQLDSLVADGAALLSAWTDNPGDVWQKSGVRDPNTGRIPDSHMFVAYGPGGVLDDPDGTVRFGVVDRWSETIPNVEHSTTAGFGFNAPASRAPQAVIIGSPPSPNGVLADGDLAAIVIEARRLARVRMTRQENLSRLQAALPVSFLPAAQPAGIDLNP